MNEVSKWVAWCYNYTEPSVWIYEIWSGCDAEHFLKEWNKLCLSYDSEAIMNRFYLHLDDINREKLTQYVLNR